MHGLVALYEENAELIERFILSSLRKVCLTDLTPAITERLFTTFPNLELLYETDEGFVQTSGNYYIDRQSKAEIGADRSYLISSLDLKKGYSYSSPYISTASGNLCVTVVYATKNGYIFLDFFLQGLLERFNIIEKNDMFKRLSRISYMIIGFGLIFFGLFVVLYGFFAFGSALFFSE